MISRPILLSGYYKFAKPTTDEKLEALKNTMKKVRGTVTLENDDVIIFKSTHLHNGVLDHIKKSNFTPLEASKKKIDK